MVIDLVSKSALEEILRRYHLRPNKVLGQHFLISKTVLERIIEGAELKKTDTVIEAGPGLGALTQVLAERAERVIAVEKDRALIPVLQELFADYANVEIVQGDILKFDFSKYLESRSPLFCHSRESGNPGFLDPRVKPEDDIMEHFVVQRKSKIQNTKYKIVADIPYYLTSHFLRTFLETPYQPVSFTLLVQKEVARRVSARPPEASLLSNAVQYYASPKILRAVPASAFYPRPKVDSAVLKLTVTRVYNEEVDKRFFALLKNAFSSPRKQLFHVLSSRYAQQDIGAQLSRAGIGQKERAGDVELEKWVELMRIMETGASA